MLRLCSRLQALAAVSACSVSHAIKGNIIIKAFTSDSESDEDKQLFVDHQPYVLFPQDGLQDRSPASNTRLPDVRLPGVTPAVVLRVCGP